MCVDGMEWRRRCKGEVQGQDAVLVGGGTMNANAKPGGIVGEKI